VQVLVSERELRTVAGREGQGRVDRVPLEVDPVPEAVGALVHAVETEGEAGAQGLIDVGGHALAAVGSALERHLVYGLEAGLLGDAVDDSPAAPAAEGHRVRTLEGLHALEVVEVAVVLDVVAHPVEEEIGGRVVAADDDLVPVVFSLVGPDARQVAHDVGHARHLLVEDELPGGDRDRLRHVLKRRQRAGGAADRLHLIARGRGHGDRLADAGDREDELARLGPRRDRAHRLRFLQEPRRDDADRVAPSAEIEAELALGVGARGRACPWASGTTVTFAAAIGARVASRTLPWNVNRASAGEASTARARAAAHRVSIRVLLKSRSILKMNFNFSFKILATLRGLSRALSTGCEESQAGQA
jgi:hypothetical protein